ncbi:multidrug efflux RND transporter permease subunit [Alcaligenes ammonioxydans]|jgi:multidrug efflux pump|uniref:Efflux pump membrane transporter n=1 Tax=Alcaligenes ammonioxydans TaxID=2582914 RepID=A0ABX8STA2_9BURK|nr:efflux RND transporter permease subunit [Alcaligenes ammonioxydans]MCH1878361.1 multidrug efflux RND transporter permease subunit [Alcaligenes ammonioxydans]QBH18120.1 multidrug efflux RND transporter permease subunit [Alcaligenes faecalis]QXX79271.1 multidrug efflux RND transporter permease subunit [Alcaligenes ammonioxydans]HRK86253.1 efflux RND transporter permease subunit [Alcaligenes faecalis]
MPQFFIERPIFAWVVALAITLFGLLALPNMPVAQYPDVAPPSVTIRATYPGATAEDVASTVASVIEDQLNGAKGLLYYESVSDSYGSTEITATFRPGTNPDLAQVDVQNRVSNITASLPTAVMEQGLHVEQSSTGFLLVATLSSTDGSLDQTALADYIERNIKNTISRVPGVARFQLFASGRAMRVWLDPAKLVGYQMTPSDVTTAIRQQNMLVSAGILGGPPNLESQRVAAPITVNGQLQTVEEFENIILRSQPDGSTVRIKDVARVEVGADNYQFGARLNSKPTAAFAISLLPEANALDTAAAIKAEMEKLSEFFPDNIRYDIPYDTSPYVDKSITQVVYTLLEAMVLVFIVMYVFLQNVRYTVIPALVVPVAILGAFAVMQVLGMSVNVLTMFAMVLAIGILVDDAIVVVENVERIMVEDGLSPKEATKKAMPQISGAIVGITLVLSAVFLPLAFMAGSVGVIYRQFSVAMAVSIAFSGFLALTFTPALCATLLKPIPKGHHETKRGFFGWFNRVFMRTTNGYESFVGKTLRRGGRMMFIYLLMVLVLGFLYVRMPTAFLPEEDQGYVIANIELPAGSTANRTIETIAKVEDYFKEQPQVENIIAVQGFSFNGSGLNSAIAFVPLKDFNERKGEENSAQAISGRAMGQLLFGLPDSMVIAIVPPAISALGNSSGIDMRLEDRAGMGHDALMAAADQLLSLAKQSPVFDPQSVRITGLSPGKQIRLEIDRDKAAALGVNFSEVSSLISGALGSSFVGKFTNQGRVQNVWLQADAPYRMTIDDVLKLNARNSEGKMVPLSAFVSQTTEQGPVQIVRYNSYESVRIGGGPAPGYTSGEAMIEMENLMKQLPSGFGVDWTGLSYQERQAAGQSTILMGLAVLVVFMLLAALYESWAIPLSVMLAVPLGMLGSVLLVSGLGMPNDVYFQVGIVTVIGLSAKNAILIVEFAKDAYARGATLIDATLEAARLRFRPILMTSFAFVLGVVPLATSSGAGAASQNAVGLGVLGGMLAATPLAVLMVPTFFVVILKLFKTKPRLFGEAAKLHEEELAKQAAQQPGSQGGQH